jgi:hypothetical protein
MKTKTVKSKPRVMLTLELEDQGQDFLRWDVLNGVVVGCSPFQGSLWNGTKVLSAKVGYSPEIVTRHGERTFLRYPVTKITKKKERTRRG